jgi:hypothetical protein
MGLSILELPLTTVGHDETKSVSGCLVTDHVYPEESVVFLQSLGCTDQ